MKVNLKSVFLVLGLLLVVGYLLVTLCWGAGHRDNRECRSLRIEISDLDERQYLTTDELLLLLRRSELYPVGMTLTNVSTQGIEDVVCSHPMVRTAQAVVTPLGNVRLRLTQRVPVLLVLTPGESYYVDSDRRRMPVRQSVTTPVLIAEGSISEQMAVSVLFDMAQSIADDAYWHERIRRIEVANPKSVSLIQQPDGTRIILGVPEDYKAKLQRLRTLYEEGFDKMGWQTYRELDLRYNDQVVGRK